MNKARSKDRCHEPNNHHFIPRFILENWAKSDGMLMAYVGNDSVGWDPKIVYSNASPSSIGCKRHLYSFQGFNKISRMVETNVMCIDGDVARTIRNIDSGIFNSMESEDKKKQYTSLMKYIALCRIRMPYHLNETIDGMKAAIDINSLLSCFIPILDLGEVFCSMIAKVESMPEYKRYVWEGMNTKATESHVISILSIISLRDVMREMCGFDFSLSSLEGIDDLIVALVNMFNSDKKGEFIRAYSLYSLRDLISKEKTLESFYGFIPSATQVIEVPNCIDEGFFIGDGFLYNRGISGAGKCIVLPMSPRKAYIVLDREENIHISNDKWKHLLTSINEDMCRTSRVFIVEPPTSTRNRKLTSVQQYNQTVLNNFRPDPLYDMKILSRKGDYVGT